MRTLFSLVAVILAGAFSPAGAAVIHVPGDQPTIQAGIDAAVNGDTVLVADGTYTGPGNRDIDFLGKAIIVRSAHGPGGCIVDAQGSESEQRRCFVFQNGEGRDSVLQGFTIRGGDMGNYGNGGGVECVDASPIIRGNVITGNLAYQGAGINSGTGSPLISGNRITANTAMEHLYSQGLGGGICCGGTTEICGNVVSDNLCGNLGGGICIIGEHVLLVNNLIVGNSVEQLYSTTMAPGGGGVAVFASAATVINCTIALNAVVDLAYDQGYGGGLCNGPPDFHSNYPTDIVTVVNAIVYGNTADFGTQFHVGATMQGPCTLDLSHSDVEGGEPAISNLGGILNWGDGMIDEAPLYDIGSLGSWYLMPESPCVDAGGTDAALVCYDDGAGTVCLDQLTTRIDRVVDTGMVDMGYHYPPLGTVGAAFDAVPSSGSLPFSTTLEVALINQLHDQRRRVAGRIDIEPAGGGHISNWRSGSTNINGGRAFRASWSQLIPALPVLVGDTRFTVTAVDVSPSPYNQPPYAPSGDTATAGCTVTGLAP
jgi:hypothetical protein